MDFDGRKFTTDIGMDIEIALANYNILPEEEISPAASFIRACLQLNSSDSLSLYCPTLKICLTSTCCTSNVIECRYRQNNHDSSPWRGLRKAGLMNEKAIRMISSPALVVV